MKNFSSEVELLKSGLLQWGIEIDDVKVEQFRKYVYLLVEYNEKVNLTAITEPREIIIQHFLDSLGPLTMDILQPGMRIMDVGSGAGFPGIPIKIAISELDMVLLDASKKRVNFLNYVIRSLGLDGITAVHGRAEELGRSQYREAFDVVVSRAVAPLRVLCEYCIPFLRPGGFFLSYKGPGALEELEASKNAIDVLGGNFVEIRNIKVPFSEKTHNIVVIRKEKRTPNRYPRSPGKPQKSPL
ncbi:MAG: 16S rRNA (guanine(527)-N(7))-methyltransferase RsmG [Caldicoprobacter oshimai]|uniref:Ribosomal RNA small subunit methyltransferase G n=1 Tax=Caldicoprobacter faecalis TaxID=937334 RepID=A0A1I5X2F8_9FIRM|nr:16S rRNA (guanine(527)-N(7))-methyltransferase RsmG [Caldicoprobacter faecalis]PZN11689.1 MAG: 16S rRNA (guanine(527)-N(7))-methyltransferase RsmG [Caldicoprobacter oshimai]SFQ25887.1 16S rRNA m(7)G-527 methyltransferase [Caldicoprobacter faecalis]